MIVLTAALVVGVMVGHRSDGGLAWRVGVGVAAALLAWFAQLVILLVWLVIVG